MAFENNSPEKEDLRSVKTSLEIAASPQTVWQHVIAFPQLDEPDEFIFKTGIAYPVNATINGHGVGAVRHCNFSTGSLVEGTTWYVNKIKPDFYWTIWSDFIVHKIHQRVLNHIKTQAEK
jgi:hypothetical protein